MDWWGTEGGGGQMAERTGAASEPSGGGMAGFGKFIGVFETMPNLTGPAMAFANATVRRVAGNERDAVPTMGRDLIPRVPTGIESGARHAPRGPVGWPGVRFPSVPLFVQLCFIVV